MPIYADLVEKDKLDPIPVSTIDNNIVLEDNKEENNKEHKKDKIYWASVKITEEIEEKIQKLFREEMLEIQNERNEEQYDFNYEYFQNYYEGKFPKTTFPLGDLSCEKHIGLATMYVDIIVLKALKHTLSSNPIILLENEIENEYKNELYKRQQILDNRLRNYIKIQNLYPYIYREACIHGVAWVKVTFVNDIEKAKINKVYFPTQKDIEEFINDNPNYKNDKNLQDKLQNLVNGEEINVIIDKDIPIFIGMKPELIKGQKLWVRLKDTNYRKHRLIAEELELTRYDIENLVEQNFLDRKQVEKLFDDLSVIKQDEEIENDKFTIYESIIYCNLENKGIYRYIAVIEKTTNRILRLIYYPDNNQNLYFIPFYTKPKHKRTVGYSLIELSIESNDLYDSLWRALINQIILAQKPPLGYNSDKVDTLTSKNFEAGQVTAGLSKNDVWQLDVDFPNHTIISALQMSGRQAEFPIGISSGMSGQESLSDPRAPMGKTAMLLSESNMRVESYIIELQKSNSILAELIEKGEIQYNLDNYIELSNKKIDKNIFEIPVNYIPQALSSTINTQNDLNIIFAYLSSLAQYFPNVLQNKVFQYEILNLVINNSGGSLEKIKDIINPNPIEEAKDLAINSYVNLIKKTLAGETENFSPEENMIFQTMNNNKQINTNQQQEQVVNNSGEQ